MIKRMIFVLLMLPQLADAGIRTYTYPPEMQASQAYAVTVDGQTVLTMDNPIPAAFAAFELQQGPVKVEIECNQDVKWVDVRPLSAGIKPTVNGRKISFSLSAPGNFSLEVNGRIRHPLFLFANPPEVKPSRTDPGLIYFEAGKVHKAGVIRPQSNQQVFIEGGAVVMGAIAAQGVKNVKVGGYGILDGTYNNQTTNAEMVAMFTAAGGYTVPGKYQRFIEFSDSENLSIEGLILNNSTTWQVVPINCDRVNISGLKIISDNPSDDGIDIVRSRHVHVDNCFVRTKDDCVAVKALLNYPETVLVDGVVVENCVFWNALWGNGLEIGFELLSAEVKNITFRNCDIIHVEAGAVFSIHNSGQATVKNVLFENIRVEDARQKFVDLAIFRSRYCIDGSNDPEYLEKHTLYGAWDGVLVVPPDQKAYHARFRGKIENIRFSHIYLQGLLPFSIIAGYDEQHSVEGVSFDNIFIHGQKLHSLDELKIYQEYAGKVTIND